MQVKYGDLLPRKNSKHTCSMTKTDHYFEELPRLENKISTEKKSKLFNKDISMTSFWLVQRQPTSRKTDILTAISVENTEEEEKHLKVDQRHNRTQAVNDGHQKTRYSSQIGLIYLKPVVHYSTSVYFHSNNDFSEEPRPSKDIHDIRYDICIALGFHSLN